MTTVADDPLTEDEVKQAVKRHLESRGYQVAVRWGRERGVDIEARGRTGRFLIEAKGDVARSAQEVTSFLAALGELIQRMHDPEASYGLALPDTKHYRGLVERLPKLARERLGLVVYFVTRTGTGYEVTEG